MIKNDSVIVSINKIAINFNNNDDRELEVNPINIFSTNFNIEINHDNVIDLVVIGITILLLLLIWLTKVMSLSLTLLYL